MLSISKVCVSITLSINKYLFLLFLSISFGGCEIEEENVRKMVSVMGPWGNCCMIVQGFSSVYVCVQKIHASDVC